MFLNNLRRRYFKPLRFHFQVQRKRENFKKVSSHPDLEPTLALTHSLSWDRTKSVAKNHLQSVNCDLIYLNIDRNGQEKLRGTRMRQVLLVLIHMGYCYGDSWFLTLIPLFCFVNQNIDCYSGQGFLGMDTGNPAADHEAEMWIAALIGTLMAAVPVALLNPSLGFRRKRSALETSDIKQSLILSSLISER